jgi:hypothetical protein
MDASGEEEESVPAPFAQLTGGYWLDGPQRGEVQVEVTRPTEKSGNFVVSVDGSNQRVREPQPAAHWLTRIIGNQVQGGRLGPG